MLKITVTVVCLSIIPMAASAADRSMSGNELADLVSGAIVEIDTPLGKRLPIEFSADGRLVGRAPPELASYLGTSTDSGRWRVSGDQLCYKWNKWLHGEQQCLRIAREGARFRWRKDDGMSGLASISPAAPPRIAGAVPSAQPEQATRPMAAMQPATSRPAVAVTTPVTPPARASVAMAMPAMRLQPASAQSMTKAPAPEASSVAVFRVVRVDPDDELNVRESPSADAEVVGTLRSDQRGLRLDGECRAQWCPVTQAGERGWINRTYLAPDERTDSGSPRAERAAFAIHDSRDAPRTCLTEPARALLDRVEQEFGPVQLVSTCRPGATIAGSGRPSRHASGNAIDFNAGDRKRQIVDWLVANHRDGGTMTYADMDHIHVDIGRHFVSLAESRGSGRRHMSENWASGRMGLSRD